MEPDRKNQSDHSYYYPARSRANSSYLKNSAHNNAYRKAGKKGYRVKKIQFSVSELKSYKGCAECLEEPRSVFLSRRLISTLNGMPIAWRSAPTPLKSDLDLMTKTLKSLLNKLTPTNLESIKGKISEQMNEETSLVFANLLLGKACMEIKYSETYSKLSKEIIEKHPYFRNHLLYACQNIFETQAVESDDISTNKRKVLGCVAFVGELINLRVVSGKVGTNCCKQLLLKNTEEAAEGVCYLLSTCSGCFSSSSYKEIAHDFISELQKNSVNYSTRVKFQVQDLVESRKIHTIIFQNNEKPRNINEFKNHL